MDWRYNRLQMLCQQVAVEASVVLKVRKELSLVWVNLMNVSEEVFVNWFQSRVSGWNKCRSVCLGACVCCHCLALSHQQVQSCL